METTAIAHPRDTNAHANQTTGIVKAKLGTYAIGRAGSLGGVLDDFFQDYLSNRFVTALSNKP